MEELDQDAIYRWPACEKWEYQQIVYTPEGHIDASPRLDFYEAAKASVNGLFKVWVKSKAQRLSISSVTI